MKSELRKAGLMLLLAIVSTTACAKWVEVVRSDKFTVYADRATVREAGNMLRMWNVYDYRRVSFFEGKRFLSLTMQYEYDCREKRRRLLYLAARSQNMGKGDAIITDMFPHEWTSVPPDSVIEELWKHACRKR